VTCPSGIILTKTPSIRRSCLRILTVGVLLLFATGFLPVQEATRTNPGTVCGDRSNGLPDFYYESVIARIEPPDWKKSLIRISVEKERKLALWSDGKNFKLWAGTPEITQKSIGDFLLDLDQSCRLPADPAAAAAFIKIKWESSDLSAPQFEQIHRDFTEALSHYVARIQNRYGGIIATRLFVVHLDSEGYSIVYDNSYEHLQLEVWNMNDEPNNPMLDWVHGFKRLAEEKFKRAAMK
jgi:hypothetical protein